MQQGRFGICNEKGGCDSANPTFKETQSDNDDWTGAKFLGKTEVERVDTYAERTMELQVGRGKNFKTAPIYLRVPPAITLITDLKPPERTISQNVKKGGKSRIKDGGNGPKQYKSSHQQQMAQKTWI